MPIFTNDNGVRVVLTSGGCVCVGTCPMRSGDLGEFGVQIPAGSYVPALVFTQGGDTPHGTHDPLSPDLVPGSVAIVLQSSESIGFVIDCLVGFRDQYLEAEAKRAAEDAAKESADAG